MIHLIEVAKRYYTWAGDRVILFPTSLTIPTDRAVAVLGRNGAGKSTLIRMLAGVEKPDYGRVVRTVSVSWPLGYGGGMSLSMTGRQNIRFLARVNRANEDAVVDFVEDFAELGPYLDEPVGSYSSGMHGRLSFGISLAIDFDYYLIDEATGVGDQWFQEKCAAAFSERRRKSKGLLMASHNPQTIRQYCEKGLVLYRGHLVGFDDLDEAIHFYCHGAMDA